jgi:TP901 family phage tail tape measure protein
MATKISAKDLFESEDLFKGVRDSADDTIRKLDEIKSKFKTMGSEIKSSLKGLKIDNISDLNKILTLIEKANALNKQANQIDELRSQALTKKGKAELELLAIENQKLKNKQEQIKVSKLESQEAKRIAKEKEKEAKQLKDQSSAYKELERNTRELKNQSKELAAQMLKLEEAGKKNGAEYRKLANTYKVVTQSAQEGDRKLKDIDRTVGDNFRNVGNYRDAINQLQFGLGQLGIAFGFSQVVGATVNTLKSFDEEAANIAKTVNTTTAEAKSLSRELLNIDTRTSVENLQRIAVIGGQLGIGKKDIVGFTESIDKLNVALGDEFTGGADEITSVIGGLRNVLSDIKSKDVSGDLLNIGNALNVLGAEGSATSPVISDFAGRIGGVGIPLGLTSAQVLGLSSTLQELNITAERGGTATQRLLKEMASNTAGFAEFVGMPMKEFANLVNTDLMGAFNKVVAKSAQFEGDTVGLAQALDNLKIDGAGASEVLLKLSKNQELLATRTDQAGKALNNTKSINDEFAKKNDTLAAKIEKLKNAFDKYILGLDESGKMTGSLGAVFDFLANNLGNIISLVGKIVRAWLIYKGVIYGLMAIEKLRNTNFKDLGAMLMRQIPMTRAYKLEQIQLARAQQMTGATATQAGSAVKGFGSAIASIGWMALIAVLAEVAVAWYDIASGAAEARRQQDMYEKAKQDFDKSKLGKTLLDETKGVEEKMRQLDLEIRRRKAAGEDEKALDIEKARRMKELNQQSNQILNNTINNSKRQRSEWQKDLDALKKQNISWEELDKITKKYNVNIAGPLGLGKARGLEKFKTQDILTDKINNASIAEGKYKDAINETGKAIDEYTTQELEAAKNKTEDYSIKVADNSRLLKTNVNIHNDLAISLKEVDFYLDRQKELLNDINNILNKRNLSNLDREINAQITNAKKLAKETGQIVSGKEGSINDQGQVEFGDMYNPMEQFIVDRYELEKKYAREQLKFDLEMLDEKLKREKEAELKKLDEDYESQKKQIDEAQISKKEKDKKLLELDNLYDKRLKELEDQNKKRDLDNDKEKLKRSEITNDELIKIENDKNDKLRQAGDELLDSQDEYYDKEQKEFDNNLKEKVEKQKDMYQKMDDIVKASTDFFIKQSERKVAQLDKEIQAAEKTRDMLKELAVQGNIDAKQSIAEQDRIIAEANKQKEKELRKQNRIKLTQSVYEAYSKNLQNLEPGEKSSKALTDTIKDVALLQAFLNSLPAFESGTEDTGKNGSGIDGKGGFQAILHPNERVIPKNLNDRLKGISNEELTRIAIEYQNGKLLKGNNQSGSALDLAILVNKLDEVNQTIRNKPENYYGLGEVTQSMVEIIDKQKRGNTIIYNRYKVRK